MFDVITGRRSFARIVGSAAGWCEASAKKSYAPERVERCGVLTACVARRAAELLNAQALGKPLPASVGNAETARCVSCHEVGGAKEDTRTKMDCQGCHFHLGGEHPTIRSAGFDP